ncbi:hypothetical protein [Clostridium estertheticum]|uniref:hypothetical protein n=1 Tax=Clostridium estertheticum TaxID=238834 RepID=UPI001C7D7BE6|nr:hypothetical protein [Clostridium estertheticum]MBX4265620.1 hypothetical protein [Clostridium estertheticum]WLC91036.1 hypothetical protein KTC95_23355 [Clostridium estertheticum]
MNDKIVERVIKVFLKQLDFICLYEDQISKWHNEETLTATLETEQLFYEKTVSCRKPLK